ncbi:hypothetical protein Tco_0736987, partial [Tanacetum coccineum]
EAAANIVALRSDPMMDHQTNHPVSLQTRKSFEAKESQPSEPTSSQPLFDDATLEKSVPPGYLKFINNLESEIVNVSTEKETLKIEVMRAQAMIDILQSQITELTRENVDLKRGKQVVSCRIAN